MIERHPHVEAYPTIYDPWPKREPRLDEVVTHIFKEHPPAVPGTVPHTEI